MRNDVKRYYRAYLQVLNKLHTRADLPPAFAVEWPALYGHFHLVGACYAFVAGKFQAGQERLRLAAQADPLLMQGTPPAITINLAGIARSVAGEHAAALIRELFKTLSPDMEQLRPWRRHTMGALHMQKVFAAHNSRTAPQLGDWLHGVFWDPRWLAHRGVWSILVRRLLLRQKPREPAGP
jgi:hypothetical protein